MIERAEHLVLDLGQRELGLPETGAARVGQRDEVAPAVLGGARACDEPVALELVEQAHEVRPVDLQRGGQRLLRHPAVVAQDGERDEVTRAQAERHERGLGAGAVEAREVVEEGTRCPAACGVLDRHVPSVELTRNDSCATTYWRYTNELLRITAMHLLHIDSSIQGERSVSRRLTARAAERWRAAHPGGTVTYRDLGAAPLPHVDQRTVGARMVAPDEHTPDQAASWQLSQELVAEIRDADTILSACRSTTAIRN